MNRGVLLMVIATCGVGVALGKDVGTTESAPKATQKPDWCAFCFVYRYQPQNTFPAMPDILVEYQNDGYVLAWHPKEPPMPVHLPNQKIPCTEREEPTLPEGVNPDIPDTSFQRWKKDQQVRPVQYLLDRAQELPKDVVVPDEVIILFVKTVDTGGKEFSLPEFVQIKSNDENIAGCSYLNPLSE